MPTAGVRWKDDRTDIGRCRFLTSTRRPPQTAPRAANYSASSIRMIGFGVSGHLRNRTGTAIFGWILPLRGTVGFRLAKPPSTKLLRHQT